DLEVVDSLRRLVGLNRDNCQRAEVGVAEDVSGLNLSRLGPAFSYDEERMLGGDRERAPLPTLFLKRDPQTPGATQLMRSRICG
ncbi:MAG: hypothetical protein AAGC79_17365, partial [Pseudomonadota bacterium]